MRSTNRQIVQLQVQQVNIQKVVKFDFIHIHTITSRDTTNIIYQQPWLSIEDKAYMVKYQGRVDMMLYVATGCEEIRPEAYETYQIMNRSCDAEKD
jgi:hypothetical protein